MKRAPLILLLSAAALLPGLGADPSTEALPDETGRQKYRERSRILVDLDGDGKKDMLLSNPDTAGNSGVDWSVYRRRQDGFHRIGNVWAHPDAISFERIPGESHKGVLARIWVYIRGGAGKGSFGYQPVTETSVGDIEAIGIYPAPGNGGIGEKLYAATFRGDSPVPFELQHSKTTDDGAVSWHAVQE